MKVVGAGWVARLVGAGLASYSSLKIRVKGFTVFVYLRIRTVSAIYGLSRDPCFLRRFNMQSRSSLRLGSTGDACKGRWGLPQYRGLKNWTRVGGGLFYTHKGTAREDLIAYDSNLYMR